MKMDFSAWMQSRQQQTNAALARFLPDATALPPRLHEAMRYAALGGGKRVRPLLVFAAGEITDAPMNNLEIAACAVELIHAYSLVHDDMPAMDNDVLRRGLPTCHIQYDEATALLVGDSLQTLAFDLLSRPMENLSSSVQLEMVAVLAKASGSKGMAGGQAIDLAAVGCALSRVELETMHRMKTGALILAAVELGVLCGKFSDAEKAALYRFGEGAGLLFQVVDDILDCTAPTAILGKTAGKDAAAEKPTFVSLMGLDAAQSYAERLFEEAHDALQVFDARANWLRQLTAFIAGREK